MSYSCLKPLSATDYDDDRCATGGLQAREKRLPCPGSVSDNKKIRALALANLRVAATGVRSNNLRIPVDATRVYSSVSRANGQGCLSAWQRETPRSEISLPVSASSPAGPCRSTTTRRPCTTLRHRTGSRWPGSTMAVRPAPETPELPCRWRVHCAGLGVVVASRPRSQNACHCRHRSRCPQPSGWPPVRRLASRTPPAGAPPWRLPRRPQAGPLAGRDRHGQPSSG
jgi:hypothetical protein